MDERVGGKGEGVEWGSGGGGVRGEGRVNGEWETECFSSVFSVH